MPSYIQSRIEVAVLKGIQIGAKKRWTIGWIERTVKQQGLGHRVVQSCNTYMDLASAAKERGKWVLPQEPIVFLRLEDKLIPPVWLFCVAVLPRFLSFCHYIRHMACHLVNEYNEFGYKLQFGLFSKHTLFKLFCSTSLMCFTHIDALKLLTNQSGRTRKPMMAWCLSLTSILV